MRGRPVPLPIAKAKGIYGRYLKCLKNAALFVLQVTVVRRNGADGRVTVEYSTKDGSASAGTHFKKVEGTLVFNAGALGVSRCGGMWRGIGTGR